MTEFSKRVYAALLLVPRGKVTTYGAIAAKIGVGSARAVGNALHANPRPIEIPCHRVVDRDGKLTPNFAFGGIEMQQALLENENVPVICGAVDLKKYGWYF